MQGRVGDEFGVTLNETVQMRTLSRRSGGKGICSCCCWNASLWVYYSLALYHIVSSLWMEIMILSELFSSWSYRGRRYQDD